MKSQRPEYNPVIKFALELIDRIAEVNILTVDLIGDILLKQGGQVLFEGVNDEFDPLRTDVRVI